MALTVGTLQQPWTPARSAFTLGCRTLAEGERRERRITAPNLESVRVSKLEQGEWGGRKIPLISKKPEGERKRNMNR